MLPSGRMYCTRLLMLPEMLLSKALKPCAATMRRHGGWGGTLPVSHPHPLVEVTKLILAQEGIEPQHGDASHPERDPGVAELLRDEPLRDRRHGRSDVERLPGIGSLSPGVAHDQGAEPARLQCPMKEVDGGSGNEARNGLRIDRLRTTPVPGQFRLTKHIRKRALMPDCFQRTADANPPHVGLAN